MNIPELINKQQQYFKLQHTKDVSSRISLLKTLKKEILSHEEDIYEALHKDFKKPKFETYLSEFAIVISELDLVIRNLRRWAKPKMVKPTLLTFPSLDYIYKEPYGTVLIIGPWNYPFLLTLEPAIMAIAAGNTVVVKPSELTTHTSNLVTEIFEKVFNTELATTVHGGVETATELLAQKWDYIFFTGSVPVGKIVAQAAAKHLTPVTLELGGKSPCVINEKNNLKLVARRLVWGKFINGGQTCIAPDYILVNAKVKSEFIAHFKNEIERAYGADPQKSEDFSRIINDKNVNRLKAMLNDSNVIYGGKIDESEQYIAPTLIDEPSLDSTVMQEEIFGPILPILSYDSEEDLEKIIWSFEKPLSFYVFSKDKSFIKRLLAKYSFGGGAVNDALIHFGNHRLPFGGVGASGIGAYHGKRGFDTFSHEKSISKRGNWTDPPLRYAPYKGKLGLLKRMFKYFG
jgi:aldehyde dehydrogenase (NAD+)